MTKFKCPDCGAAIKAPDDAAGKQGKCPGCGRSVTVPLQTTAANPKVFEANAFVLRDETGNKRAELNLSTEGEPMLAFFDSKGNCRIKLGLDEVGDSVHYLYGENQDVRAESVVRKNGRANMGLTTADTLYHTQLIFNNDGQPGVQIRSKKFAVVIVATDDTAIAGITNAEDKNTRVSINVMLDAPWLLLKDTNGKIRLGLTLSDGASPSVVLMDPNGKTRASLILSDNATPALGLCDQNGKPRVSLTLSDTGDARLAFLDGDGKPNALLSMANGASQMILVDEDGDAVKIP